MSQNLISRIITSIILLFILFFINFSHQYIFILSILILGIFICVEANNLFSKLLNIKQVNNSSSFKRFNSKFLILNIITFCYIFFVFCNFSYEIHRSEGPFFQFLYQTHKFITLIFTGRKINFGNYSCLTKQDIEKLSTKPSLWSSYSGTVKKNLKLLNEISSVRGLRYFGPSQMSLFKLLIHSFSIIAVFKYQVFLRTTFILIILAFLSPYLGQFAILLQLLIVLFNLIIFIVSFRENENELVNSHNNLESIKNITHH